MHSLVFKMWVDMLEEEASNSDSNGRGDLVQSSPRLGKPPKMLLYLLEKPLK